MTVNPHPFVMSLAVARRRNELLAEANRYWLAQRAAGEGGAHLRRRADLLAVVPIVSLALLVAV